MDVKTLIATLFDKDVLITPQHVQLLTPADVAAIVTLLDDTTAIEAYLQRLIQPKPVSASYPAVQILKHYTKKPKKRSYQDFVQYFNIRFQAMEKLLRSRPELTSVTSIERTKQHKGARQRVAIIGYVLDKHETKNNNIILELEDRSGAINVLVNKTKQQLLDTAQDLCLDEVIGITGTLSEDIIFADEIITPSMPLVNELKKSPDDAYMVCISDVHFGNKNFFEKEFQVFLDWLSGKGGDDESRSVAKKVKYLIISGDLIEGVGVYPSQENDLSTPDIYEQYLLADSVLSQIPEDKHIIIIPGNHDIGRLSEPQSRVPPEFLPKLSQRDNVHFLSNPCVVRLHQTKTFPGFTVLVYHGGSFFYYGNNIMRLFREGGMSNPCGIMQYLLTKRHLSPTHTATLYVPDNEEDPLIISEIPDFFITGHLHTTQHKTWNGITLLSCSCWVPLTEYQIKAGLLIDPGKFMLVDLHTRNVQALKPEDL